MGRFLIFIIFLILIQKLIDNLQKQQKKQPTEPTEEEVRDYFQDLGLPPAEEPHPEPKIEKAKESLVAKKELKKVEVKIPEVQSIKIKPQPKQPEETEEELFIFSRDKLEEGIVLSVILGPPRAYQICRGGGIGIRAGLKNR